MILALKDAARNRRSLRLDSSGKTILFVTHNLGMITHLCEHAILLQDGGVKMIGPAAEVVDRYNALWSGASQGA